MFLTHVLYVVVSVVTGLCLVQAAAISNDHRFIVPARYRSHAEIESLFASLAEQYPSLARVHEIGRSVEGRKLLALQISDNVGTRELLEPKFKYVANIHGNEAVGRELVLNLARYLLENYRKNDLVTRLVDTTDIFLMPTMNPDGFQRSKVGDCMSVQGRANANNVDLNRDFPDQFRGNHSVQTETQVMMDWVREDPNFVLSANMHGGALVASYPYDGSPNNIAMADYSKSPDDALYKDLALTYSMNHETMGTTRGSEKCYDHFDQGITNGAFWYSLYGGMQDYSYVYSNSLEITLELSCCKYPTADRLPEFWDQNRNALLKYMAKTHTGVKGLVRQADGTAVVNASVKVEGNAKVMKTSSRGEYWRLLLPGDYTLTVSAPGYNSKSFKVSVPADDVIVKNVTL